MLVCLCPPTRQSEGWQAWCPELQGRDTSAAEGGGRLEGVGAGDVMRDLGTVMSEKTIHDEGSCFLVPSYYF